MTKAAPLWSYSSVVDSEGEDFKGALFNLGDDLYSIRDGAFVLWYRLVKQYSLRSLTRSSDKLPAISGLAAMIAKKTRRRYLAGIWEQNLHALAWSRDVQCGEVHNMAAAEECRRGPSWSWTSISGPASYRFYEEKRTGSENDAKMVE